MKKFVLLSILLITAAIISAQGITFTTKVQRNTISLDEELLISYTIRGGKEINKLDIPTNFSFRTTNEFQSFKNETVNGVTTTTFTKSFTLQPLVTGSFVFPKAMAIVDGFTVYSDPVKVTVVRGKAKTQKQAERVPVSLLAQNENPDKKVSDNIELVQTISQSTCYVGENLISKINLYARLQAQYNFPTLLAYNGFSIEDQYTSVSLAPSVVRYKGNDYSFNEIRSVHLFPLKDGDLTIDPLTIEASVPLQKLSANGYYETIVHQANIISNKISIKVLPLPKENKPSSFTGGVGKFSIEASVATPSIFAEELNQLEIIISGEGNLPLIHLPKWNAPDQLVLSQSQVITDYRKEHFPFRGAKKFSIPFYAKEAGTVTIPSIEFSYFDPAQKSYITTRTDAIVLNVQPATIQNRRTVIEVESNNYWWWVLLPIGVILVMVFIKLKYPPSDDHDEEVESDSKKTKLSYQYFDATKKAYWNNDSQGFYRNLKEYLVHIIEEKDGYKITNQRNLDNYFQESSFTKYQIELIGDLFNKAQTNRFSPLSGANEYQQDFQKFERLAQSL